MSGQEEFDFLLASGRAGRALGLETCIHLDQPLAIRNYIRIADEIARRLPRGDVLDWGCGYGQMTYLLKRRGLRVTSFDIGGAEAGGLPDVPLCQELELVRGTHPTELPFEDARFDAILSCGVLEHVDEMGEPGNELASLREIGRVLRPGGPFFIYQLPQRYAWQEAVIRHLRLGYAHPRRYTLGEITGILGRTGYVVERVRRANLMPKNLTGMPGAVRRIYGRCSGAVLACDAGLCAIPALNQLAGVLEITARRTID